MFVAQTLLLLSILVIIHELGHFWAARLFGVGVLEFSVGFGPLLAKRRRGKTQYSLRAIPLGGYVKLAGMDMTVEGRSAEPAEDDPTSLKSQPAWKKVLIVSAGPLSNLLLTALTFTVMFATVGVPRGADPRSIIGNVEPKSPAYEAGLSPGDRVVAVSGKTVRLWQELVSEVRGTKGRPVTLTVLRAGRTITRTLKPLYDPAFKVYLLGIIQRQYFKRMGIGESIGKGVASVYWFSVDIVRMVFRALKGQARLSLSGPVGAIGAVGQSIKAGPWWFLYLVASINLFLALFNLLPVPLPLMDGGWVAVYLLESLRGREFSTEEKTAAQFFGLLVLFAFFLFVTYGDLRSVIRRFLNR